MRDRIFTPKRKMRIQVVCGALLLFFSGLAAFSCSGRLDATIRSDSTARMALRLDVPEALSARVRQIGDIPAKAALFDTARLKEEFAGRKSIFLVDVSAPSLDSLTSVIWIPDMYAFIGDKTIVPLGMIEYKIIPADGNQPAQRELSVTVSKDNALAAYSLFPGIDKRLIDGMSPPALESDPVSAADYRMNLETVIIGKKAMPAFDACALEVTITAPKTILSCSGGSSNGQVFKAKIPLFDLLTLEKPVRIALRWAE